MMPSRGYLLCCVERTGSNLLSGILAATGMAGKPMEYFNPVEQKQPWMREVLGESDVLEGFPKVLSAGTTPNGVFAAKVHWAHFRFLGMSLAAEWSATRRTAMYDLLHSRLPEMLPEEEAHDLLRSHFPDLRAHSEAYKLFLSHLPNLSLIWLRRRNMVARAVSHFRARRSGVWFRAASGTGTDAGRPEEFDLAEIHTLWLLGGFQDLEWERFFRMHDLAPLVVTYEDLVAEREQSVRRTLEFLRLDTGDVSRFQPRSARQSDEVSQEWEQRYREWNPQAG